MAVTSIRVIVPDLSDQDSLDAARDALDQLHNLPPGDGPTNLDDILDMLLDELLEPRPAIDRVREAVAAVDGDRRVEAAVRALDKALADRRWDSDVQLSPSGGSALFAFLQQVVRDLEASNLSDDDVLDLTDNVVDAAAEIVVRRLSDAEVGGATIDLLAQARALTADAQEARGAGDKRAALAWYQDAWDLLSGI